MNEKPKILEKPKETICLLIYGQKLNVGEINDKLYPEYRNPKVSSWIGELEDNDWIERRSPEKKEKKDRRERYYQATSKCLLDSLKGHLKNDIKLMPYEEKKLIELFNSPSFTLFIQNFMKNNLYSDFRSIRYIISYFATYVRIFTRYATKTTGYKTKDFKKIWMKAQKKGFSKVLISDTYNRFYSDLSETPLKAPNYEYEEMLFSFINLGDDLLVKLCSLNESYEILSQLAYNVLAMRDTIDNLPKLRR